MRRWWRSSSAPLTSEKLTLLRAHPELAGKAAIRGELTADSRASRRVRDCTNARPRNSHALDDLNPRYNAKFGFPFILAVKGLDRDDILREFARRVERDHATEIAEALRRWPRSRVSGWRCWSTGSEQTPLSARNDTWLRVRNRSRLRVWNDTDTARPR